MARKRKLPLVAIIGRPNVGKSTLFNRIIGKSRAIVHDLEGITRDRFISEAEWNGRRFRVVDTGGIIEDPVDPISRKMQEQLRAAVEEARVIIFLLDGQTEPTRIDQQVRDDLFRAGKPVVLAVNKLDNDNLAMRRYDFYALGLGEPYAISSGHGLGVAELMDAVVAHLPEPSTPAADEADAEPEEVETPRPGVTRVAIVGKPNVGKSSFVNAILNEERVIVHEEPGTTRDSIDVEFRWKGKEYVLIDTAGLRKKAGIRAPVEHFSVSRTLRAIRRADVCLVMIDATEGITEQDKRILGYVIEAGTGFVLVYTKWDLIEDRGGRFKEIDDEIDFKMAHIKHAPYVTVSNVSRQRIFTTFEHIDRVAAETEKRIATAELNKFVEEIRAKYPAPSDRGKTGKIRYITQAGVKPATFVLFVNHKELFHFSFQRFLENKLRERYGFGGVPIQLELREGNPKE